MSMVGYTRDGKEWVPKFIESIDVNKCMGCGRCFKVCSRGVLELIEKPFHGNDEFGDDMGNKVMSIANSGNCIGCEACSRICTKKCHVHVAI
ncbi:MAG: ferredoxin III, nif-specific [Nitrospirae bacterium]|nr:ferredoxin III, nif-specific [Nitrospirota bacterium]